MSEIENTEPSAFAPRRRPKPKSTVGALIVAAIVALFLGLCSSVGALSEGGSFSVDASAAESTGYMIGRLIGGGLFIALPVWLVLYFAFVRRRNPDAGPRHFVILLAVTLIGCSPVIVLEAVRGARASESAEVYRVIADWKAGVERQDEADMTRVNALVGNGLIDPALLAKPGGVAEAKRRASELRTLWGVMFDRAATREAEAKQLISTADIPEHRRRQLLAEVEASFVEAREDVARSRPLVEAQADEIGATLTFLQNRSGSWRASETEILFQRAADAQEYNRHIERLQAFQTRLAASRTPADAPESR